MPHMREDHETREMILDDIWTMLVTEIAASAWYWSQADRATYMAHRHVERSRAHMTAALALSRALNINTYDLSEYIVSLGIRISCVWVDSNIDDIVPHVVKDLLAGDEVGYSDPTGAAQHSKTFTV